MSISDNLTINIKGKLMDFSTPWVMGIVNVTPDSFFAGSRVGDYEAIKQRILQMRQDGAIALDVGGYSTRPGAAEVSSQEEYSRVALALDCIRREWPEAIVSVDTFRAEVAAKCVAEYQIDIINDISGGDLDDKMFETVAETGAAYVLMHTRGTPQTMQQLTDYKDVTAEVITDLAFKMARLHALGVKDILIDPGFGFAKTLDQNYELMARLDSFKQLGAPLFVGISRKSMITKLLGITPNEALEGTTVLNTYALEHGADILRVHDVKAAAQAVKIMQKILRADTNDVGRIISNVNL
ncbi:MAG: dihydropteroate synthase [Muribaculaceae bacterium]|nr:dihydropteroate synthase [Muribaculaceae bacterium]